MKSAVVIGAGPAGLMAAEAMADAGLVVTVAEQKPSVGRKFLMAGKSGLNLTKHEDPEAFLASFRCKPLAPMIQQFGPEQVVKWAELLGQSVFTGSSGRIFPTTMKASPLLRAWLARLADKGVTIETRWAWRGFDAGALRFETPTGVQYLTPDTTVLAMGGASWRRLGSDGAWTDALTDLAELAPFKPSNMGLRVGWSPHMTAHFGAPIKNLALTAGRNRVRAEAVITKQGLEGGGIYAVSATVRDGAPLVFDLLPDLSEVEVSKRLSHPRGKATLTSTLRKRLKLDPVKIALLNEFARPLPDELAPLIKALPVTHQGPTDMDGAISTSGGVCFGSLDACLMLNKRPGTFVAGEMLDWEAPTGGYLITGCLATGLWAGQHAAKRAYDPSAAR